MQINQTSQAHQVKPQSAETRSAENCLESQARQAADAGDHTRAMRLFDQAVAEDPRCAFRVYNACLKAGLPNTKAYEDLWKAQTNSADADKFAQALDSIYRRRPVALPLPQARPTLIGLMHRKSTSSRIPKRDDVPQASIRPLKEPPSRSSTQ